jgi:hypothetical protein
MDRESLWGTYLAIATNEAAALAGVNLELRKEASLQKNNTKRGWHWIRDWSQGKRVLEKQAARHGERDFKAGATGPASKQLRNENDAWGYCGPS